MRMVVRMPVARMIANKTQREEYDVNEDGIEEAAGSVDDI